MRVRITLLGFLVLMVSLRPPTAAAQQVAPLTIELKDYVTMPMTGVTQGTGSNEVLLSRVNAVREEPGGANRLFVADLNGPRYILDKATRKFTTYLDFDSHEGRPVLAPRFISAS